MNEKQNKTKQNKTKKYIWNQVKKKKKKHFENVFFHTQFFPLSEFFFFPLVSHMKKKKKNQFNSILKWILRKNKILTCPSGLLY